MGRKCLWILVVFVSNFVTCDWLNPNKMWVRNMMCVRKDCSFVSILHLFVKYHKCLSSDWLKVLRSELSGLLLWTTKVGAKEWGDRCGGWEIERGSELAHWWRKEKYGENSPLQASVQIGFCFFLLLVDTKNPFKGYAFNRFGRVCKQAELFCEFKLHIKAFFAEEVDTSANLLVQFYIIMLPCEGPTCSYYFSWPYPQS